MLQLFAQNLHMQNIRKIAQDFEYVLSVTDVEFITYTPICSEAAIYF